MNRLCAVVLTMMKTASSKKAHTKRRAPLLTTSIAAYYFQLVLLIIVIAIVDRTTALRCYKCAVYPEKNQNHTVITHMCSKFEESDEYIVNCEFSTMCLKTIATLHLQNGQKLETITRGCAQQKDTTQVFRDREWHQEHSVQEVYTEGCSAFNENNLASAISTHCYCRGELCNDGIRNNITTLLLLGSLAVIFFVYMK